MNSSKFTYLYYVFGVLCGFLLGSSLDRDLSAIVGKVIFAIAVLLIALYWRRVNAAAHARHMESWQSHHQHGEWRFILINYVLFRGGVLLIVFLGPIWVTFRLAIEDSGYVAMIVVVLVVIAMFLGHEEWDSCEQEFQALSLRQRAEQERESTSLKN